MSKKLAAVLALSSLALLSGCASPEPQALELTWVEPMADGQTTTAIDFGTVTCKGDWSIVSDETASYPEERPTFKATVIGEVTAVSLLIEGGYIFVSSDPFTMSGEGVTFDEQPGHVSRNSGSESMIDTEATISGTVSC